MIEGRVTGWVEQHVVPGARARADFAFLAQRVVVEAEGYAFHAGVREFTNDCARYNRIVAAGWTVVRVTWRDLDDPEQLCTLLRTVLGRRPERPGVVQT
jgi:very-short-patch-repair endonuclease